MLLKILKCFTKRQGTQPENVQKIETWISQRKKVPNEQAKDFNLGNYQRNAN